MKRKFIVLIVILCFILVGCTKTNKEDINTEEMQNESIIVEPEYKDEWPSTFETITEEEAVDCAFDIIPDNAATDGKISYKDLLTTYDETYNGYKVRLDYYGPSVTTNEFGMGIGASLWREVRVLVFKYNSELVYFNTEYSDNTVYKCSTGDSVDFHKYDKNEDLKCIQSGFDGTIKYNNSSSFSFNNEDQNYCLFIKHTEVNGDKIHTYDCYTIMYNARLASWDSTKYIVEIRRGINNDITIYNKDKEVISTKKCD